MLVALIIAFLGLIIGQILASHVKEELKQGKKWFELIRRIVLIIIIIRLLLLIDISLFVFIAFLAGILVNYFLKRQYFYFGLLILVSSYLGNEILLFFTSLIFIFGLAFGSLIYCKKRKFDYKATLINLVLFSIPLLLLLIKDFTINNSNLILGFVLGGLIIGIKKTS